MKNCRGIEANTMIAIEIDRRCFTAACSDTTGASEVLRGCQSLKKPLVAVTIPTIADVSSMLMWVSA